MSRTAFTALAACLLACSSASSVPTPPPAATSADPDAALPDAAPSDTESPDTGAPTPDASDASTAPDAPTTSTDCAWGGAPGQCISVAACAALPGHSSYAGQCPGPADIQCCIKTPSTADNPPIPTGYRLMQQAEVTPDMTTWAVAILDAPATYPMFSTTTKTFGALSVLARVEWHPPDFQNSVVHRGVTLYLPL